jgi:hypothetical protein
VARLNAVWNCIQKAWISFLKAFEVFKAIVKNSNFLKERVLRTRDAMWSKIDEWAHFFVGEVYICPAPSEEKIQRDLILKRIKH